MMIAVSNELLHKEKETSPSSPPSSPPSPPSILEWMDDVAQWVHSCRSDVVGQWHQVDPCGALVEDIVSYLLDAWYTAGETTQHLLGEPEVDEDDKDGADETEDAATTTSAVPENGDGDDGERRDLRRRRDRTEGQVELATVLAKWIVGVEFADVPPRSCRYEQQQQQQHQKEKADEVANREADNEDATITLALQRIDDANRELAAQRTAAWHHARSQIFSAAPLSKLLSTPAQYNALVYEKCSARAAAIKKMEDEKEKEHQASADTTTAAMTTTIIDMGPRKLRYRDRAPDAAPMRRLTELELLLLLQNKKKKRKREDDDASGGADNDAGSCGDHEEEEDQWTAPVFRRVQDARNWGTKMEPMSAALYCHRNGGAEGNAPQLRTDLGCLRHREHAFLGASPDGVVVGPPGHPKRGYNVEIKNIVDRPITGDPKVEYYVQFQAQMEVCDLPHTDFLETKFSEYEFADDYFLRQRLRPDLPHGIVLHFWPERPLHSSSSSSNDAVFCTPEEEEGEVDVI